MFIGKPIEYLGAEHVFPVIIGQRSDNSTAKNLVTTLTNYNGTAFGIGGDFLITANHVVADYVSGQIMTIGFVNQGVLHGRIVERIEQWEGVDFAIVEARVPGIKARPWNLTPRKLLADVLTMGYPYALNLAHERSTMRAFKGHVIAASNDFNLPEHPPMYELSFQAPRGLSGAPLFNAKMEVMGLIVANGSNKMLVHESTESTKTGDQEKTTLIFESLSFGVAIQTSAIAAKESPLLGCTVGEHLAKHNLLVK